MSNRVLITCPYYYEGLGGVATFYNVYAEKQQANAYLFHMGADRPCGDIRKKCMIAWQYVKLFFKIPHYDLVVVNPSPQPTAISRDTLTIKIARFFRKKTCVFWRGFNDEYFRDVLQYKYKRTLQKGLFNVDFTIVLGSHMYECYKSIGLNTPYALSSTMVDELFIRTTPKTFNKDSFNVLFLARPIKEKGIYEALDAFKSFQIKHKEARFIIAGDSDELKTVLKYVDDNGILNVESVGYVWRESKKSAFEQADLYILPSYAEGMPNSVLEAMGMGLPVIVSAVGGIPDFFENGEMGVLMKGHSCEEIRDAYETMYQKREDFPQISNNNHIYAKEHFTDKIVINQLEKIFENI